MAEMVRETHDVPGEGIFAPLAQAQTYLNIVYLLLAFPLGIFYFVFLITGLSVGISLVIVWIGIPLLLLMLIAWWGLAAFERELAIRLLRFDIPPMKRVAEPVTGLWPRLKAYLTNPVTWKGLAYLLVKFPLGIVSFVLVVTLVSVSLSLLAVPFAYPFVPISADFDTGVWLIDTFGEALVVGVIGLALSILSVYVMNWLAWASGWFAALMLGDARATSGEPASRPALPAIRMNASARVVAGALLVGLGVYALISQFLAAIDVWFWPLALIIIGLALAAPRVLKVFAAKDNGEPVEDGR